MALQQQTRFNKQKYVSGVKLVGFDWTGFLRGLSPTESIDTSVWEAEDGSGLTLTNDAVISSVASAVFVSGGVPGARTWEIKNTITTTPTGVTEVRIYVFTILKG